MIQRFVKKLPAILQTEVQKEFYAATFDQLFNSANVEQAQGFIGRRSSDVLDPAVDNYLGEPNKNRASYQLEPIAYAVNAALQDSNHNFYEDLLNYVEHRGGNIDNHDRLFSDLYYSFAPPIDVDKFLNYQNYLWLEASNITNTAPTAFIQAPLWDAATYDTFIESDIIGATDFNTSNNANLTPGDFQFSTGMRVQFEGSASYDTPLYVECVGRGIRLVEDLSVVPADLSIADYITSERGSCEGSPWSRSNRWFHEDAVDSITALGQLLGGTITDGGLNYEVGDPLLVNVGDGSDGSFFVSSIALGGVIDGIGVLTRGTGYSFAQHNGAGSIPAIVEPLQWDNEAVGGLGSSWDPNNIATKASGFLTSLGQTEADFDNVSPNGTYAGGASHVIGDFVTLDDGTIIEVENVLAGVVTEFTITTSSTSLILTQGTTQSQTGSTGPGTGFSLTLDTANELGVTLWDDNTIVTGNGSGALIDGILASAVSRSNKAARPILEFKKDIELYNFGNRFIGEVTAVAETESFGDIQGAGSGLEVDGHELVNGDTLIFLNPVSVPTFQEWDKDPDAGFGTFTGSRWDESGPVTTTTATTLAFADVGSADTITGAGGGVDFLAEGFTPGQTINIAGSASNDGDYEIAAAGVTSTVITLASTESLVTEGAVAAVLRGYHIAAAGTTPWDVSGATGALTRFIWHVDLVTNPGVILLERIDLETGIFPSSVTVDIGENILILEGTAYQGSTFYQELDVLTVTYTWELAQSKDAANQQPLFSLYDGDGITLDDSTAYPVSTFIGNEIYSYKVLTQQRLTEQGGGSLTDDPVLGFPLETKGFRELGDVIFENDLETDRVDYTPTGSATTEIVGYYFFKVFDTAPADCTILGSSFETNWQSSTAPEELRVIDRFLTTTDDENTFPISGGPVDQVSGPANFVVTQGRRLNTSEFAYIPETNSMKLLARSTNDESAAGTGTQAGYTFSSISEDFEVYIDGLYQTLGTDLSNAFTDYIIVSQDASTGTVITFVTAPIVSAAILARQQASGAPGEGAVVELLTYTFDAIADEDLGYFEIPNALENNPNNLEVLEQSWNEFTPHYTSIITEQAVYEGTAFGAGNNYRDTLKDGSLGTFILQNQSPLIKTMLCTSTDELDIVEALRLSSNEYTRYKNKFIRVGIQLVKEGFTPQQLGNQIPVSEWVDEAIRRIIRAREYDTAFNDTYMIAWNTVYQETVFVGTGATLIYSTTDFVDLEDKRNVLYVYIDEILQAVGKDYTITNLNPIQITMTTPPSVGASIVMRLFGESSAAHIPATPTKLGLYTAVVPAIITDDTYANSTQFILGHDGSRTPVYNSIIDELLLEFETRIYNGIIEGFRKNYTIPLEMDTYKPGKFRSTRWELSELQDLIKQSFYKWVSSNKADYITNGYYDALDPFTWNYKTVVDVDGELLPGYWRGIFDYYYDSQTPDTTPWEMLGFSAIPDWWESTALLVGDDGAEELALFGDNFTGYGSAPYVSTNAMWSDLENGYVRRQVDIATEEIVLGYVDTRYARTDLVADHLPVDVLGALKASPLLCIDASASLVDPSASDAAADYDWTDKAPVEYAWETSESFPFAVAEALFLARPGEFGEKFWDPEHIYEVPVDNEQIVSSDAGIFKRIGNSTLYVHGEVVSGVAQIQTGYQVWIAGRLKSLKKDVTVDFGNLLRTLDVKLGHKMAAFTNKDTMKVFVEGISVTSQASNLLVPAENIDVALYTGAPVTDYVYSGALVRALADDQYQVFGYDVTAAEFIIVPRVISAADQDVTVGGQPETFIQFAIGTSYMLGMIARLNGIFYRCIEAHQADTFEADKWLKLNKLPITGGVSATYKVTGANSEVAIPYGHKFNGVQEVFDFLVGLGEAQTNAGWTFETVNSANNTINNWVQAAKDFLFWVGTQWEENSIIQLSPMAEKAILIAQEGYVDNVEQVINGVYAVLDKNGVAIDPINTIINRVDRRIELEPDIEQTGIYGLHAITRETENIVTFDNVTVFNDTLYDPVLGSRLARLDFRGRRTREWTGKLEAAGFIITANGLLPNYENMVDSIRNYHNTEVVLDNPAIEETARHLIGFDERDYFTDLGILDDAQYQFYQGMVRQKGTRQAVEKMERNKLVTDIDNDLTIIEEWALRLDSFGAVCVNNFTEFLIAADEVKVDPQLVQLAYPATESVPPTYAFDSVDDVTVTDDDPDGVRGDLVTIDNHNYRSGAPKTYSAGGGTVVGGLLDDTEYYIIVIDEDRFQFALTKSDATSVTPIHIDLTSTGVGTAHTLTAFPTGVVTEIDLVSAANTYTIAPTVFITNHPDDTTGSGATAVSILDTDGSILRIDILTGGTGYSQPPQVAIGLPVISALADRATARISFDVATDDPSNGAILIDIDDETRWITKPGGVACDVAGEVWPDDVLDTYNTTNAGYVHSEDANFQSFSEADVDSLATAATVPSKHGQTIWVARDAREEFGVYGLDGYKGSTILGQVNTDFDNVSPNGTFFGGTGYVATEIITLSDGTQVTVNTVSSGAVVTFNITLASQTSFAARADTTLTTASSNGLGNNDFTLTPGIANEESGSDLLGIGATLTQTPAAEDDGLVTLTSIPREDLIEAQFTIDVDGEVVEAVTVIGGGFGYTRDAEFTITSNTVPSSNGNAIIEYQVDAFGSIATANVKVGSTGSEYYVTIDTVTVAAGGTGYSIDDVLTVVGGTGVGATLTVDEVATIASQTYLLFDGVTLDEGTFAGGTGHDIGDIITLTDGSTITVDNATVSTIALQTEADFDNSPTTEGTFTAGTDYLIGDIITMSDGTVVQVTGAGDPFVTPVVGAPITAFQIISASTVTTIFNNEVLAPRQAPPSGGAGFTLTLDVDNVQVTPTTGIVSEFTVTTATTAGITTDLDTIAQASSDGTGVNFSLTLGRLNQEVFSVEITTRGEYSNDASLPTASGAATTVLPSGGTGATVDLTFFDDGIVVSSDDIIEPTGWRRYMGNSIRNEGQIYANNVLYDYVLVSGSTYTLSKDGEPIEDNILADDTEYFTLMNLRFRTIGERRIFESTLALFGSQSLDVDNVTLNDLIVWTDGENSPVTTSDAATLIFADDNPDTITRTGGSSTFVSEGFFEGQTITITGTVSNNGTYTIATSGVEPFVITLIADDTLVSETIASTITGAALNTVWTASEFITTATPAVGLFLDESLSIGSGSSILGTDVPASKQTAFIALNDWNATGGAGGGAGLAIDSGANTITRTDGTPFDDPGFFVALQEITISNSEDAGNDGIHDILTVTSTVITLSTSLTTTNADDDSMEISITETAAAETIVDNSAAVDFDAIFDIGDLVEIISDSNNGFWTITDIFGGTGFPEGERGYLRVTPTDLIRNGGFEHVLSPSVIKSPAGVLYSYNALRIEAEYIETYKFENAFVYENDTKDTLAQIPVYDPFKGIIPGTADLNITWKSQRDPARYTNASVDDAAKLVSADLAFDGDQVGLLWWDQSTSAYLHYEQGTDEYRRDNWGKLFSGSSVDVYEWTRSTSLPTAYTGDGIVRSLTNYTELQEWDPILERVATYYYFWVKDRTEIPGGVNRTIAAFEVASIISNPAANLYQWFSPVSQSGFMFSGVDGVFTDSDNVFQINFRRSDDERPTHVEWELGRENDPSYVINNIHWDKTVDSLVGYTVPIPIGTEAYTDDIGEFNTDPVGATDTSGIDSGTEAITFKAEHGFSNGNGARYSKAGGIDTIGLTDGVMYYIEVIDSTSVYVHSQARQANPLFGVPNPATRVNIASVATPALPLLPEVHKLTVESLALNNFNNALPTAADPTMGYLVVPDPTLSAANQLGIRTRPMQTMFFDIFDARRVYVDKINQLTESIILRDENPLWNATLSTNDLWEWVDWYLEGFDETNSSPIRQVDDTSDLVLLLNPLDGDIVKVIGTRFSLYEYSSDTELYTLIMREASRLNLLSTIYTTDQSLATALELRELILAIETEVFVNELVVNNNLVYFAMLNYVFSEQDDLDWAFKSTYIFLDQTGQTLSQPRVFQEDPFDSALEYITEAKPYQTKVRDFRVTRATELDLAEGEATEQSRTITSFMVYDQIRGGDLSVTEMRIAKFENSQSSSYKGYSTLDNGTVFVRLGAAGRAVNNYRTELADIQAPTGGITADITVDVAGGQLVSVNIVTPGFGGTGYTNDTGVTLTLTSTAGGGNGTGEITYDIILGVITNLFISNSGSGYINGTAIDVLETPLPNTGTTLAEFDPAQNGNPTTTEELEAVALINTAITSEFFFDYQGSFLQNTSFGGLPTLGSYTLFDGGSGYVVGDILQLDAGSGTPVSNAQFRVSAEAGTVITALDLIDGGSYIQTPTIDPVDLLGGSGSGAQLTALVFENGSSVPHDTTPWDQIGFESSVNDPSVTTLDGSPDDLTTTVPGSTQSNYDGVFPNGSFAGGSGYKANTGSNDYTSGLTFALVGGADTITRTDGTAFNTAGEFTVGQRLIVTLSENTGENDGTYTIVDVTATVITLSTSDVLVNTSTPPDTTAQLAGFDTIIMQDGPSSNNGSNITVDVVAAGVVTGFTLTGGSTAFIIAGDPILQASSNDAGIGFVLTTGTANTTQGTFANIPSEETFSGNSSTKEFEILSTVPTFFMFVVVDDIEQVLNVDYFFIGTTLTFVSVKDVTGFRTFGAPSTGTDNIQIFTYIEAGDLINPQVTAGISEEMVPLDPRENLIVIADSTDIVLTVAGTGYAVGETLTATGGVRLQTTIAAQDETDFDGVGSNGTFTSGDGAEVIRVAPVVSQSLAFDGSNTSDTITRTGGTAFDTLGFASGQKLIITGSENLGENDGTYTIVNVTATVITLSINDAVKTNTEDTTATLTVGSTAYVVGDIITMTDQTTVTVDAVDVNGDVTDFTVTTASGLGFQSATILSQISITQFVPLDPPVVATGFSITPDTNNEDDFGSPLTIDVVTTSSGPPGPIATFTVTNQGDYFVYPTSPFATTADASGVNATFTLTALSYRIHHDTQQNLTSHRYADGASTALTATLGLTDNLIPVTLVTNLYSTTPTLDDPQIAWIGTERIEYHGVNVGANQLTGVVRGTQGTHAQTHQIASKVFDGGTDQVIPASSIYWVNSATTSYQSGAATGGIWINNGNGNVHFADVVETTFVTTDSVVVGDTLRVTTAFNSQIQNSYFIKDLIASGEVSIITVDIAGTGYSVGDTISVASLEGALGPSATPAVLEVGGVYDDGSILYVTIVDRGTGYTPGGAAFTISGAGDGNAQISVTTNLEGVVLALSGDIINEEGRISENYGVTWVLDRALPGGLNAATTVAAAFIQLEEGNALPISLSP